MCVDGARVTRRQPHHTEYLSCRCGRGWKAQGRAAKGVAKGAAGVPKRRAAGCGVGFWRAGGKDEFCRLSSGRVSGFSYRRHRKRSGRIAAEQRQNLNSQF